MLAVAGPIKEWNGAISGTTVAHLGKRHLEQIQVVVPERHVLEPAMQVLDDTSTQVCDLIQASRRLASMRELLLPKLVTGQIDVSALDLDAVVEGSVA